MKMNKLFIFIIGCNRHQFKSGSQAGGRAIRRGEGGRCGDGRAFMVARGVGRWSCFGKISVRGTGRGRRKRPLPAPHPLPPYGFSSLSENFGMTHKKEKEKK